MTKNKREHDWIMVRGISEDQMDYVLRQKEKYGISMSAVVRKLIQDALEEEQAVAGLGRGLGVDDLI